jgi:hypothetical protein
VPDPFELRTHTYLKLGEFVPKRPSVENLTYHDQSSRLEEQCLTITKKRQKKHHSQLSMLIVKVKRLDVFEFFFHGKIQFGI